MHCKCMIYTDRLYAMMMLQLSIFSRFISLIKYNIMFCRHDLNMTLMLLVSTLFARTQTRSQPLRGIVRIFNAFISGAVFLWVLWDPAGPSGSTPLARTRAQCLRHLHMPTTHSYARQRLLFRALRLRSFSRCKIVPQNISALSV
jgi:hypothetical protein